MCPSVCCTVVCCLFVAEVLASDEDDIDEEGQQYLEKLAKAVSYTFAYVISVCCVAFCVGSNPGTVGIFLVSQSQRSLQEESYHPCANACTINDQCTVV